MIRKVRTEEAIGKKLAYDTTIVTPEIAGTLLPRGHIISPEDVEKLKNSGVYYVWVEEEAKENEDLVYEWEITPFVASKVVDSSTVEVSPGRQGLTFLYSKIPGVLEVDGESLTNFNMNMQVYVIVKQNYTALGAKELLGTVEVIPLSMKRKELEELVKDVKPFVKVRPFTRKKIGVVITGTEIYEGRKKDEYLPIIRSKAEKYGWEIVFYAFAPDDEEKIVAEIKRARDAGAEGIIVTGGMSVDPTDRTPIAIRKVATNVIAYGVPIKPTTMSLVALWDDIPILGISAGGIHSKDKNSIDVIFTRMMAGIIPSKRDIASMGLGGILESYKPH